MDLSKRVRDHWGLSPADWITPFGTHIESDEALFTWPDFDAAVDRMVMAVRRRKFLIVSGLACSAKTTAWNEAKRTLQENHSTIHLCQPRGLAPVQHTDQDIYTALKHGIEPPDGTVERRFKRGREEKALQCRQMLERCNSARTPVALIINDAHACRADFLVCCKRLWDDLYGYDRLLAMILIGQPTLLSMLAGRPEINLRTEILRMPGLGDSIPEYVQHEWQRTAVDKNREAPLDETAYAELAKLATRDWTASRDHPLVINNIIGRALVAGHRIKERSIGAELIAQAIRGESQEGRR